MIKYGLVRSTKLAISFYFRVYQLRSFPSAYPCVLLLLYGLFALVFHFSGLEAEENGNGKERDG